MKAIAGERSEIYSPCSVMASRITVPRKLSSIQNPDRSTKPTPRTFFGLPILGFRVLNHIIFNGFLRNGGRKCSLQYLPNAKRRRIAQCLITDNEYPDF